MLKSYGVVGWDGTAGYMVDGTAGYMVVAHMILVSAQGLLILVLRPKGLGPGLDNRNLWELDFKRPKRCFELGASVVVFDARNS